MQPGIELAASRIDLPAPEAATAVPVFIGYTRDGGRATLYALDSWSDFLARLGDASTASTATTPIADAELAEEPVGPTKPAEPAAMTVAASACRLHYSLRQYFDNGGGRCFVLSVDSLASLANKTRAELVDELSAEQLFAAIGQEPQITLMALPDVTLLDAGAGVTATAVVADMARVWRAMSIACTRQRNLFAVLDTPADPLLARRLLEQAGQLDGAQFCAAYWPHLVSDFSLPATDDESRWTAVPPSGAVLAAIQRTDLERGIWKAPANVELNHIIMPQHDHLDGADLFNSDAVSFNLIRSFPGRGLRIWGCRTVVADPASRWRYVQVRRLVSYIEASLGALAQFSVFEPNNEITWFKLKGQISLWLRKLWRSGALFGREENEAFRIAVGLDESMRAEDIAQNRLIINVALAVLQPAEFIDISLRFDLNQSISTASLNDRSGALS